MKSMWIVMVVAMATVALLWDTAESKVAAGIPPELLEDTALEDTEDKRSASRHRERIRGYQHIYDPYPFDFRGFYWIKPPKLVKVVDEKRADDPDVSPK